MVDEPPPTLHAPRSAACDDEPTAERPQSHRPIGPAGGRQLRKGVAEMTFLLVAVGALVAGAVLAALGRSGAAAALWAGTTLVGIVPGVWWIVRAARRHQLGVDVVAVLAQAGTLAIGEPLAGAIITVMLASGRMLESRAGTRAERDLRALTDRAPRIAHIQREGALIDVPADEVTPGDALVIQPGEVVPVDGRVGSDDALIDPSALTGAPRPGAHLATV